MQTIQLTGKTYEASKQIKAYKGIFDGATKSWSMPVNEWEEFQVAYPILARGIRAVGEAVPVMTVVTNTRPARTAFAGVCPRCHSYCMGDCSAN